GQLVRLRRRADRGGDRRHRDAGRRRARRGAAGAAQGIPVLGLRALVPLPRRHLRRCRAADAARHRRLPARPRRSPARAPPAAGAQPHGRRAVIALETRRLDKSFGSLAVAQSISLAFEAGLRYAIIGPNGAGKTTYFNLLAGNLRPDAGTIHFA